MYLTKLFCQLALFLIIKVKESWHIYLNSIQYRRSYHFRNSLEIISNSFVKFFKSTFAFWMIRLYINWILNILLRNILSRFYFKTPHHYRLIISLVHNKWILVKNIAFILGHFISERGIQIPNFEKWLFRYKDTLIFNHF